MITLNNCNNEYLEQLLRTNPNTAKYVASNFLELNQRNLVYLPVQNQNYEINYALHAGFVVDQEYLERYANLTDEMLTEDFNVPINYEATMNKYNSTLELCKEIIDPTNTRC